MKGRQLKIEPVKVSVASYAKELELEIVWEGRGEIELNSVSVARPGLQLSGYFVHFDRTRVQVIGNAENEFLNAMTSEKRYQAFENLIKRDIPCLIFARGLEVFPETIELCKKYASEEDKKFVTEYVNKRIKKYKETIYNYLKYNTSYSTRNRKNKRRLTRKT